MNITLRKMVSNVFKNHKLFSSILVVTEICRFKLSTFCRFLASEIAITRLGVLKLGKHTASNKQCLLAIYLQCLQTMSYNVYLQCLQTMFTCALLKITFLQ